MSELKNTIAVETGYLETLQRNGGEVLKCAKEVTEAIEKYTKQVDSNISQLPAGVKRTGTQAAIAAARKHANSGLYSSTKTNMDKILKKMMEEVPKYDKTCGETADQLITVTKSLTNRLISLENLVVSGSITWDDNTFSKQLEQCKEEWEKETQSLEKILKEIQKSLKGVQDEACRYSKDPVNLSTGNFIYDREDLRIRGSVPLSFHRYYNSLDERSGVLGEKWKHNYEIYLLFEKDNVIVLKQDGREECFKKDGEVYTSVTGSIHSIRKTDRGYQYEEKYGFLYTFDELGKLFMMEDANKNQISFTYDQNGRLKRVESRAGYLVYHYNEQNKLESVKDHTGRTIHFDYDGEKLSKVTTPMKVCYRYAYGADGNLKSIENPQEVMTVKNRFDREGRTKKQSFPDGGVMRFSYDDNTRMVAMTERNGSRLLYEHDARYRNVRTAYVDGEETWTYNRNNQMTSYTDKNGNRTVYIYDEQGNLIRIVDACGNAVHITYGQHKKPVCIQTCEGGEIQYHYDERANLIKQTDPCGNVTQVQYNDMGKPVKVIQADGSEITLNYDARGNVVTVIQPDGGQVEYTYDGLNRIIQTTNEDGNKTWYTYDDADRITAVTNAEGNTRKYTYNVSGFVTEMIDFDGGKTAWGYNAINKPEWEEDKEGNITRYTYDLMWNISRITLPNTAEIIYEYNGLDQLEHITNPLGGTLTYHYDKNGNITRIENTEGDGITYTYDEMNRRTSMTDTEGNTSRIYYDAMGRVIRQVDAMGRVFDTVYDLNGNRTAEVNSVNGGMTYTYDCMGRMETMTDGAGRLRTYSYDVCGRIQQMEDFDGRKEDYIYDQKGNIICKKDSTGTEYYYAYDVMDRLTEVRCGEQIVQSYTYDAVGNRTSVTDANGNRTKYHYTPNGHMDQVTDPMGNVTSYSYDAMGNLEKIVYLSEGGERKTVYERNLAGQVTKVTDALGNAESYEYDCYGRMIGKTDRNGQHTRIQCNAMGDVTHIRYADDKEVYLSYDPLRQLKELQDWTGTTQFVTDDMGRTREITDASGNTVTYEWGILGERTGVIYPDGQRITYQYDKHRKLKEVIAGEDTTSYVYDENGRLSQKIYANGMRSYYTYTTEGRLKSLLHEDKEGILDHFLYTYDAVGNCIAEERERRNLPHESGSYQYIYDALGRLTVVEKDGNVQNRYEYDPYGNRTAQIQEGEVTRYCYNEVNQLIQKTKQTDIQDYVYDANGNLLQVIQNGKITDQYQYDSVDNMIFAQSKQVSAVYQYNAFKKKIGMETGLPEYEGNREKERMEYIIDYTKDYDNLLQRKTDQGTETYFWDDNLLSALFMREDGLLKQRNLADHMIYLLDQLGSPLHFCDAEGMIVENYGYDVFGEDLYADKDAIGLRYGKQPFRFTGYEKDAVNGLYYAQARRYDAINGRFISRDRIKGDISSPLSQNEYAYCLGNPMLYVDRDGREPQLVSGENYKFVGYDEKGTPVIQEKKKRTKEEKIKDAELLDQTYDWTIVGLQTVNDVNDILMPYYIRKQPRPNNIGRGIWDKTIASDLAEQSKFYSKAGKVLETASYVGVVVDAGVGVYTNIQNGTEKKRIISDAEVDLGVSLVGLETSMAIGGTVGTAACPLVGTIVGIVVAIAFDYVFYKMEVNDKTVIETLKEQNWNSKNIPKFIKLAQKD